MLNHVNQVWAEHFEYGPAHPRQRKRSGIHDHLTLAFFTAGKATFEQRSTQQVLAGDVCLIPAGEPHRMLPASASAAWGIGVCTSCYSGTQLRALLAPFERVRAGASAVVRIPGARQQHLAAICTELQRETSTTEPSGHRELVQTSLLALVLAEVARAASPLDAASEQPTVVGAALHFIEQHCLGPLTLQAVAAAVQRSPAHLTTAVKRATGKTVVEWIIAGRLAEARARLLHSDERIDAIAERVGYADPTHFIRMFRREHGMTPTAWRRE